MKKIILAIGMYCSFLQGVKAQEVDSLAYKKRALKFEEINLVAGYYDQDGHNSAITGGIGTEKNFYRIFSSPSTIIPQDS